MADAAVLDEPSAWHRFLANCEREISRVDAQDTTLDDVVDVVDVDVWVPPSNLGALPAELEQRAREIVAAQGAAVRALQVQRRDVYSQLTAVRSVPTPSLGELPIYLDTLG